MAIDNVNRPQFTPMLTQDAVAAGILDTNFPTAAAAGDVGAAGAVLDPTAGSWEALLAGTACAAGALKFRTVTEDGSTGLLIYIPTVAPTVRT